MSFAGLKKQFNKADQFVNEKLRGAEGTKLDEDYLESAKKIDVITKLIDDLLARTQEYLQPNPASRAKMLAVNTFHKLQSKTKSASYPQPEGLLGECMHKYGLELGPGSIYGQCLSHSGESFKYLAEIKYAMEDHVKESFLRPLQAVQNTELKEISYHRKKMEGRRLDYDCKKRKQERANTGSRLPDEELKIAEEKFTESKVLAEKAMINFLNSEVEQIQGLTEFVGAQVDYYRQATELMEQLQKFLIDKKDECAAQPKSAYHPKIPMLTGNHVENRTPSHGSLTSTRTDTPSIVASTDIPHGPCCRGLYDFEPENDSELPFSDGDVIRLIRQVDENWFEGEFKGRTGYFPINYVEVINPLP